MRKCVPCIMALVLLLSGFAPASAGRDGNPVDLLTGELWMMSRQEEKLAYLFGIESAICIEHIINQKARESEKGKLAPPHNLSPFEKGWVKAFENVQRETIADRVDAWLNAHPDQHKRPVLAVIWYELIAPNLSK